MATSYDLTKDFIEEVRSATDIVEVIGRHVHLRRRGRSHVGLCPFHDEKTPSFNVNPDRQMFYCFGCGAGGDVFKFLMQHENMSFVDAVVDLAKEAGLKVPLRTAGQQVLEAEKARLVEANQAALEWFRKQLSLPGQAAVRDYLKNRGIDEGAIEEFEIGFAPDSYEALQKELSANVGAAALEKAGLIQKSSSKPGTIDRFRNRIMLPIRSAGGRLIAFGGRVFGDGEPKYLNSPETPVFLKSRTLFGLHAGMRAIRKGGFAILVEGYFDALVLHRAGFRQAVAPLGTSLAEEQGRLLSRYAKKVIICMDADEAGKRAAVRSAGILLGQEFAVNVVLLPKGEDPDSFVRRNGEDAFRELLKNSEPAYHYILNEAAARHDLGRPQGKRSALNELVPMLTRIGDPIERSHAVSETARRLGIEEHLVSTELAKGAGGQKTANATASRPTAWLPLAEKELLVAAANETEKCKKAVEDLQIFEYLSQFTLRILNAIFDFGEKKGSISFHALADLAEDEEERRLVAELALDDKASRGSAWECAVSIAINGLKKEMAEIGSRIVELEKREPESKDIDELCNRKMELSLRINKLESGISRKNSAGANEMAGWNV